METNIIASRRTSSHVTLSGIEVGLQSLVGVWQKELTQANDTKRRDAFDEMLLDCITYIGTKTKAELTLSDIRKLFREDRKDILFEIRQLSNKRNPEFVFDYEFPTKNKQKYKQRTVVIFDPESFPRTPYKWVREKMYVNYAVKNGLFEHPDADSLEALPTDVVLTKEQKKQALLAEIPVMFQSYDEIVQKHKRNRFRLPECGVEVVWNITDGEAERKNQKIINPDDVSSHTQIQVTDAKYVTYQKGSTGEVEVLVTLPLDRMDTLDIEGLRREIMETEGHIETTVVCQYGDNASMQANVDLVTTAAFFFPSLAI